MAKSIMAGSISTMTKSRIDGDNRLEMSGPEGARLFEAAVSHGAHHEEREGVHEDRREDLLHFNRQVKLPEEKHAGCYGSRCRRDGEAEKVLLLNCFRLHVEARQAQRAAGHIEKGREPSEPPVPL